MSDGVDAGSTARRIEESLAIVERMSERGATARILGGIAVVLHCGADGESGYHREPEDIDLAVPRSDVPVLAEVLASAGYEPIVRFNAMHGDKRQIFDGPGGKVDVFVGSFAMCHRFDLEGRLALDAPTISVADLVLTKLQVVELSSKDAADLGLLLETHEIATGAGDWIDAAYIASVLADDWGYWRTARSTLTAVVQLTPTLGVKAEQLWEHVDSAPRSRRFKMRARIGERRRWYELPETI